jgi:CheY-like chemotaxis protein
MSSQRPIALAGLSATEQVLLEGALFQSGGKQIPGACQVHDLQRAELVIANADDAVSVRMLQSMALSGRVLLIGASDAGTGWPVVSRPLRLHALLEAVRRALPSVPPVGAGAGEAAGLRVGGWRGRSPEAPAGFAATQPFSEAVKQGDFAATQQFAASRLPLPAATPVAVTHRDVPLGDVASFRRAEAVRPDRPGHAPRPPSADSEAGQEFAATQQFSSSVPSVAPSGWEQEEFAEAQDAGLPSPGPRSSEAMEVQGSEDQRSGDRILVVGHPGTAAGGLLRTLKSEGFEVDFASDEEITFRHLAEQPYGFVFLIEVSLGPRAIQLCDAIRNRPNASPQSLQIVIVASHRGLVSRIRAWFAGCSAWMAIPLEKAALLRYLQLPRE